MASKDKSRKKEFKSFKGFVTDTDDRTVGQYFSIYGNVDSVGDRMLNGAFKKSITERRDAVKVLWQHDATQPPIGVILDIEEHERKDLPVDVLNAYPDATGGLFARIEYLDTPRGDEVLKGIKAGAITENSVGYSTIKQKRERNSRDLQECKLFDLSPVNWGANPATFNVKMAVPYMEAGIDKETEYATPVLTDFTNLQWEELEEAERGRIMSHYAYVASDDNPAFEDLMLPHHIPSTDGTGATSWDGVQKAMANLFLGEVHVPEEYRQDVWEHLAKHYGEFEEEPPTYELVNLAYYSRAVLGSENKRYAELLEGLELKFRAEPSITTLTPVSNVYLKLKLMEHNI